MITGDIINAIANASEEELYSKSRIAFQLLKPPNTIVFMHYGELIDDNNCRFEITASMFNWEWKQIIMKV